MVRCGVMSTVTSRDPNQWHSLAAAVDAAIPADLAQQWNEHFTHNQVLVARQGIFTGTGEIYGYELSFRSASGSRPAQMWTIAEHERATAHVLRATFGRENFESVAKGKPVFVRCPRGYVVGDLPLPPRPDRLVIELAASLAPDAAVLRGMARLRAQGYQFALSGFSGRSEQQALLQHTQFVRVDVRDLDLEGLPVIRVARSYGGTLIGDFVENPHGLTVARDLGVTLFQGNLLERASVVDRADAPPVGL